MPAVSVPAVPVNDQSGLRKELALRDLVMAQVLCVVGSTWVGIAAKLGRQHVAFWLGAMLLFYVPLAIVVIYLNRMMPLEGGLYQWAKSGFGEMAGFLIAWNLWVYAVIVTGSIIFVVPTDAAYILGSAGAWIPASKLATMLLTGSVMAAITLVAIRGLDIGKWLHNIGSVGIMLAYVILLALPIWALLRHSIAHYEPIPWQAPHLSWFSLAVFGQMTVGALSGFEYIAILAGECRNPARTIGQSVAISAPIIALMFILGTSSVLTFVGDRPINVIGPIPQTMRLAFGDAGWVAPLAISLLMMRAVASASLIFTGITRLPMTAGWDNLVPDLVRPAASAPADAGQLNSLCCCAGDGAHPAQHDGRTRTGGQPASWRCIHCSLRNRLCCSVCTAAVRTKRIAQRTAAVGEAGSTGRIALQRNCAGDYRLSHH